MTVAAGTPAVWFPTLRTGTGTERFTERLAQGLDRLGIPNAITWVPLRAEYAPCSVATPRPPPWATVIHVNSTFPPALLPNELPWVATMHSGMHDPALAAFKSPAQRVYHACVIRPREKTLLRRAARIVAVSDYAAGVAKRAFGLRDVTTVLNGVDTTVFSPRTEGRAPGPLRLLYVGRWSRRKGTDLIPPLLKRLAGMVEFLYTASPEERSTLHALPGVSRCAGRLDNDAELAALYRCADVLLFPSRSEGFGLVAAEAMACGLPVICADDTALRELVPHGTCGMRCIPGDVESFEQAVRTLASSPETLARMSAAARAHATTSLAQTRMVEAYLAIYRTITGNSTPLPHPSA